MCKRVRSGNRCLFSSWSIIFDFHKCCDKHSRWGLAQRKECTPAQLALAWVHAQGEDVFPIPGTKTPSRVEENIRSLELLPSLTEDEVKLLSNTVTCVGDRYTADGMAATFNSRVWRLYSPIELITPFLFSFRDYTATHVERSAGILLVELAMWCGVVV